MDEPTHANESAFWDQVADWLLRARAPAGTPPGQGENRPVARHEEDDPKAL